MSIEHAEKLKRELTDRFVIVAEGVPELRRFVGFTGVVKTVNMNGRALVQFDSPVDISWYDISPEYLTVVEKPLPKKTAAHAAPAPEMKASPPGKIAPRPVEATPGAKKSPLEMARAQGAAKPVGATAEQAAAPAGKKPSPLELARMQGAAKTGGAAPPAKADAGPAPAAPSAAPKPSPAAAPAAGKKLSPLELARMQGAAKRAGEAVSAAEQPASPQPMPPSASAGNGDGSESTSAAPAPAKAPVPAVGPDGRPLSKIELARMQGAFKGSAKK